MGLVREMGGQETFEDESLGSSSRQLSQVNVAAVDSEVSGSAAS